MAENVPISGESTVTSQTLVSFRVLVGQKTYLNWYILPVLDGPNFDWPLESLRKASKEGTGGSFRGIIDDSWILSRLCVSREATGQPLDMSPHVSVMEACRNFGRFVTFQFVEPGSKEVEGEASEPKNAFAELMRPAAAQTRSLVLPVPRNECHGDWRLFNALIQFQERWARIFNREWLG